MKEAIILAGGLGTRLRSAVPGLPKCMAPVAGKPFLSYVIDHFKKEGIERFIFSLGYKYEIIEAWLNEQYPLLNFQCSIEDEPPGTGGAIKLACNLIKGKFALILNGDTLFKVSIDSIYKDFEKYKNTCTICLKPMSSFDRYGVVETDEEGYINSFKEKQYYEKGLINGGVYLLNAPAFLERQLPSTFSFEKDYLEKQAGSKNLRGIIQDSYFIDIGIPADFEQAQRDFIPL
jgi:D-glycero-alpha-D-manno-heptose 1-phosphate guanylyltransferase